MRVANLVARPAWVGVWVLVALGLGVATPGHAQCRADRLAHWRAAAESAAATTPQPTANWSGTGAVVGGVGGGLAFAAAFYHFTHRDGALNNTTGDFGGALVGAAFGAAAGALAGLFVGSLFPKHSPSSPSP
jgi:hypothetical protein